MGTVRFLLLLACLCGVGWPAAAADRARSALVLVGGGLEDPRIYREILRLAGRGRAPRVAVITAASSAAERNGRDYAATFLRHGAGAADWIPIDARHRSNAEDAKLAARMRDYDVFFFGGGDQRRYTRLLLRRDGKDTAVLAAIRARFEGPGAVVAGTSAGAMMQVGVPMITGGESFDVIRDGRRLGDRRAGGLGFFPWGRVDTHVAQRGRQGRMLRAAARGGQALAFGVDEDSALVVTDATGARPGMRVVGQGGVTIFDLTTARARKRAPWAVEQVTAHYLTDGDAFDVRSRAPRIAKAKRPDRAPLPVPAEERADIFSALTPAGERGAPSAFVHALLGAAAPAAAPLVAHPREDPRWDVVLRPGPRAGRFGSGARRSARDLRVDIRRTR